MSLVRVVAAVVVTGALSFALSAAQAADESKPATVAPAAEVAPAEVLKTKTRSNQSNDRVATPPPAAQPVDAAAPATPADPATPTDPAKPQEVLKSKTKSNQSND